jgi:branched-chain amino acid transport system substrate-binding protein
MTGKMIRTFKGAGALAVTALLATAPAAAQQAKIKVGNLLDLTGATSSTGKISGPGKIDAFNWINANGGINGKMIEFDSVDYSYKTDRAIQQYKKWKDDGVVAIQGYGTNDTEAMVGFIAEDKIPYFSMSFSGHLTDPAGESPRAKAGKVKPAPYNFFIAASYSDGNRALLMWAAEDWKKKGGAGKPKYIHMGDNHPYPLAPKEAGEELAKELGFDVVPSIQYSLGGGDFKAQCLALQSSGANYAYLANTTGANISLVRSCATVGANVQFMSNVWGMDEAGMKAAGKAADGLVFVLGQTPWGGDVPGMKTFRAISNMSDPTGKAYRPMPYATGACHVLVLAEAMKIADKAGKLNGPGIKEALETMKDFVPYNTQGMCAAVTWTATDHRGVDTVTVGRAKVSGDTETAEVADLMEKGVMKIEKLADIKVERKPNWQGY